MALLTRQTIDVDGLQATYASAAAGGDQVVNDERTLVHIKSASVTTTITIAKVRDVTKEGYGTVEVPDIVVTIDDGEDVFIQAPPAAYNAGSLINISYDQVTGITIAALVLPRV